MCLNYYSARKNVMTDRFMCSLKVKKITLIQCGWFIKKKILPSRYAGNINTFFWPSFRLDVERKTGKEMPESSRLEFLAIE